MPYREQPMDFSAGPARYPGPEWDADGTVARMWVSDSETVGWLIRQGDDRLAWLSAAGPETLGAPLHTTPQDVPLSALLAEVPRA